MDVQNLAQMANRIADFFASMPDQAEAVDGVATHIRKFWEPRMRRQLAAHIDQHGGEGLNPLVVQARPGWCEGFGERAAGDGAAAPLSRGGGA
jgi:formate dehydrogenase subunit delta